MKIPKLFFTNFILIFLLLATNFCKEVDMLPIDQSILIDITDIVDTSGCGETNGSFTATATRRNGDNFTYSINGNSFQNSGAFNNLPAGEYIVTAKDEDGNIGTSGAIMIMSGVSFAASIQPIIGTNCAISGCHDGNRGDIPDWSVKSNVIANASKIKKQTSAKTMPPSSAGRSLTDEQIALIACWVDDGAPDN
jgi:uncharacterized membrane protein